MTSDWLLILGCIFAVNLLPAFGPPTWAVLVFFNLNYDLPAVPLVLFGALAAAGRLVLALGARHFRARFSPERREKLVAAEQVLVGSRSKAAAGLGLPGGVARARDLPRSPATPGDDRAAGPLRRRVGGPGPMDHLRRHVRRS
jgi:membrane protein implicated in regulation of membrane protease activity